VVVVVYHPVLTKKACLSTKKSYTPQKINIELENSLVEKEIPFGNIPNHRTIDSKGPTFGIRASVKT